LTTDCGQSCATQANGNYFACTGSNCPSATVPTALQVQNPVALLPKDNNGVIVELPSISLGGVPSVDGYLVLGIGTETNNQPAKNLVSYGADSSTGFFVSSFNGTNLTSFIDSGSNSYELPTPPGNILPDCGGVLAGYFCPSGTKILGAIMGGTPANTLTSAFEIGNFSTLEKTSNQVFIEVGNSDSNVFDWGLPFYLGRNIYVGIIGTTSSIGIGPYWAY
ncbi:MAG: lipoprotein of unknown function, partial [Bacteriovoracaceae bacterium]|nr:lipoprotein of unknown function [Bacteriovoracaceae bacterium]